MPCSTVKNRLAPPLRGGGGTGAAASVIRAIRGSLHALGRGRYPHSAVGARPARQGHPEEVMRPGGERWRLVRMTVMVMATRTPSVGIAQTCLRLAEARQY